MTDLSVKIKRGDTVKVIKSFDGTRVWTQGYRTQEQADEAVAAERAWGERQKQDYVDHDLPVPPQYDLWTWSVVSI